MGILPTVGVQQSIEQIPVLIQASPPGPQAFPAVPGAPVPIAPVESIREVSPVAHSRREEGIAEEDGEEEELPHQGASADDQLENGSSPHPEENRGARQPRGHNEESGHLDLRV